MTTGNAAGGGMKQEPVRPRDPQTFLPLIELGNRLGFIYGSEDIAMLLYCLVRRERPINILELGTGLGVSAFWMAQALKENGGGQIWTIDDGSHWQNVTELRRAVAPLMDLAPFDALDLDSLDYPTFVQNAIAVLGFNEQCQFLHESIDLTNDDEMSSRGYGFLQQPIDLVFADFLRGPDDILDILYILLPHLAETASLFIDSVSTSLSGYLFMEKLVDQLNHSKVPRRFLMGPSEERARQLSDLVARRKFTLMHLVEKKARDQNSTAWLKIEPNDYVPHPMTLMKM